VPHANGITVGPDGALWFTVSDGGSAALTEIVALVTIAGAVNQYRVSGPPHTGASAQR
jgi:hypothetical protein